MGYVLSVTWFTSSCLSPGFDLCQVDIISHPSRQRRSVYLRHCAIGERYVTNLKRTRSFCCQQYSPDNWIFGLSVVLIHLHKMTKTNAESVPNYRSSACLSLGVHYTCFLSVTWFCVTWFCHSLSVTWFFLDLPVNPPTVEATTPYPGPPAADTQGLCYDANGTVECSPEQLQQFVEDSKRLWEVLPEWVRQDCKTYREPKIIGCVLVIERAWFAAHPGEPIPGWMKPWGVGDQANGSFPSMDRNGVRPLFVALRQHRLFCPGGRTRRRAPGALRGSWGQS
jgi:hypothetical protein